MSTTYVSVALCTFNGARFLEPQLDSLVAQSRPPDEIVIVDDVSTDATWSMLESFAQRSAVPVHLHRNPANLGYVKNFERAIALTEGAVIFLCDQDDVWAPEKIESMLGALERDPDVQLAYCDATLIDADGADLGLKLFEALEVSPRERRLVDAGHAFKALLRRNLVTGAACAIRRTVYEAAVPFPIGMVHDEWLAIIASLLGKIVRLDVPLIGYRQHGQNQIGIRRRSWLERMRPSQSREQLRELMLNRYRALLSFLIDHHLFNAEAIGIVGAQLQHLAFRSSLPPARWARLPLILNELRSGRYRDCSRGLRSAVRDFVEPIQYLSIQEYGEFSAMLSRVDQRSIE